MTAIITLNMKTSGVREHEIRRNQRKENKSDTLGTEVSKVGLQANVEIS